MLEQGQKAPDFTIQTDTGSTVGLSDFAGKKIVLYFYPKDNTPGCTKEACSLRDNFADITGNNTVIIGISPDKPESHVKFKKKYNLPFILGSDPDHTVLKAYDAWGEKSLYGKLSLGVKRSTFIIDEDGKIIKIFKKVKTEIHGEEVQKYL